MHRGRACEWRPVATRHERPGRRRGEHQAQREGIPLSTSALFARVPWPTAWVRTWDAASARERLLLCCAGFAIAAALLWAFVWQPMVTDTVRVQRELARERATLARVRAEAEEIASLQAASGNARREDARSAAERSLSERGLKPLLTSLEAQDGRVRVTFAAIRFDTLVGALEALAQGDGLRPLAMTLTPRVEPGVCAPS